MAPRNEALCPSCRRTFSYEQVHSGFNNTGYAYCGQDGQLLVWETYDAAYSALSGDQPPWMLNKRERKWVEDALEPCSCGGRFGFDNPPRCPRCNSALPDLVPDPIYFAIFNGYLDPAREGLWKTSGG